MKRLVFLVILVMLAANVIADDVSIDVKRDNYGMYETLQFEVTIDGVELVDGLKTSDVKLKDSEDNSMAISVNLIELSDEKYFVNFDLPDEAGDYKLVLEDIRYTKGENLLKVSIEKDVTVSDRKGLSLRPGIIHDELEETEDPRYDIKLTNHGDDNVDVNITFEGDFMTIEDTELTVVGTKEFEVRTDVDEDVTGSVSISYGDYSYTLPIYLFKESVVEDNSTENETVEEEKEGKLEFFKELNEVDVIDVSLEYGESLSGVIYFKNTGEKDLDDLVISVSEGLSSIVSLEFLGDDVLEVGGVGEVNVTVNPNLDRVGDFKGDLTISADGLSDTMPFILKLKPLAVDPAPTVINLTEPQDIEEEEEEGSNWALWVFIVILLIVIGLVFMFYHKSKGESKGFNEFVTSLKKR